MWASRISLLGQLESLACCWDTGNAAANKGHLRGYITILPRSERGLYRFRGTLMNAHLELGWAVQTPCWPPNDSRSWSG